MRLMHRIGLTYDEDEMWRIHGDHDIAREAKTFLVFEIFEDVSVVQQPDQLFHYFCFFMCIFTILLIFCLYFHLFFLIINQIPSS